MTHRALTLALGQDAKPITPRELAVAELAVLGNADIGLALNISPATVAAHLQNIKRKNPELETRAAIAVWADRLTRRAA